MTGNSQIFVPKRKKIALVCSGGAAKAGAFHMGVCRALEEKGFTFRGGLKSKKKSTQSTTENHLEIDTYVGSSAGSFISSYLMAGYSVDNIFEGYLGKKRENSLKPISYTTLMSLRNSPHEKSSPITRKVRDMAAKTFNLLNQKKLLTMSGLFTTSGIESYLRNDVLPSNSFQDYDASLYIVATQLNHSRRVIFGGTKLNPPKDDTTCEYSDNVTISDAVAASTALPPIFVPYGIRNKRGRLIYYFDGEIRETLSTHVAEDAGADLVISSYTHQPYHFSREIGSLTKFGLPAICIQAIYLMVERKIQQSKYNKMQKLAALDAVKEFCKDEGLSTEQSRRLTGILEEKLSIKPDCRHISIHPRPHDHEMFFGDHFNLSKKFMQKIVRIGFLSTIDQLRKYEFEGS